MKNLNKQRGAAIIVALFVVALVAAAAAIMLERMRTDIRRTELVLHANQAYLYAQGSVAWAIDQLNTDWKQKKPGAVIDKTPIVFPESDESGYKISGTLSDAQGLFNLNNLTDTQNQPPFSRLIRIVAPEIDEATAHDIALAVTDWVSSGAKNPALDEYYLKLKPPYRAPHQMMMSVSELRLVKGVTPELFEKLSPYIFALPQATLINVNNAPPPVLMMLSKTLTLEAAKNLALRCQQMPFPDAEAFQNYDVVKNNPFEMNKTTFESNYFLLETNVKVGQQAIVLYTLLQRTVKDNQPSVGILWQSKGTL